MHELDEELEEGEVGDSEGEDFGYGEEGSEMEEGGSGEEDEEEGGVVTSLFDALAAAQEATDKYKDLHDSQHVREDHRLPEDYLTQAYELSIRSALRTTTAAAPVNGKTPGESAVSDLEDVYRVGYICEAVWPGDNLWYAARIVRVKPWKERIVVRYCGFSDVDEEELSTEQIRGVAKNKRQKKIKEGKLKRIRRRRKGGGTLLGNERH
eukprot:TRINITY_DN6323_c0_g2_i1.p1 TRINITY_DN6323_c0_g2~~TRINITY_DN6323_c0_g2_i1.p1  ORF type:complete len:209 (-),score=67.22 TRINITY_DN6323_c0_g2_i1:644-1270(-)